MENILKEASASVGVLVHEWAQLPSAALTFSPELLNYCKTNACGCYNKSWTCPPACDSTEEQQKKILSYKNVFVFTTKHEIEDSFDYEGMTRGRKLHSLLTSEVKKRLGGAPVYGAGNCPVCESGAAKAAFTAKAVLTAKEILTAKTSCAFPKPCPFPEKQIGSIEAAGINVSELSKAADIAYSNGINTVTFFSMVLL